MAVRSIAQTDTLETFRTEFNNLAAIDFGDPATLAGAGIAATSVVGAVVELAAIVGSGQAFNIEDDSSTTQLVGPGNILKFASSSTINAVVSAPDTVTMSLPNNLQVANNLSAVGNLSISGSGTHNLGTISFSGNQIASNDSTQLEVNDSLKVVGPLDAGVTTLNPAGSNNIESTTGFTVFGTSPVVGLNKSIFFEGSVDDANETNLTVANPTASRTITLPDATGTVALTNTTAYATSSIFSSAVTLLIKDYSRSTLKTIVGAAT